MTAMLLHRERERRITSTEIVGLSLLTQDIRARRTDHGAHRRTPVTYVQATNEAMARDRRRRSWASLSREEYLATPCKRAGSDVIGCSQLVRAMLPLHTMAMMSADNWPSVPSAVPSSRTGRVRGLGAERPRYGHPPCERPRSAVESEPLTDSSVRLRRVTGRVV